MNISLANYKVKDMKPMCSLKQKKELEYLVLKIDHDDDEPNAGVAHAVVARIGTRHRIVASAETVLIKRGENSVSV